MKLYNTRPNDNEIITFSDQPKHPEDINKQFGYLTIKYEIDMPYPQPVFYQCKCRCGNTIIRSRSNLYKKNTKIQSCGCYKKEYRPESWTTKHGGAKRDKHGRKSKLYSKWTAMRNRCNNVNNPRYPSYGGRGIRVCKEWDDFDTFRKWALKNGYKKGLSIDRKDNDKGYSPDNCQWISMKEQQKNKSNTSYFIINGEKIIQEDLAKMMNVDPCTIRKMALDGRLKYDYWNKDPINSLKGSD